MIDYILKSLSDASLWEQVFIGIVITAIVGLLINVFKFLLQIISKSYNTSPIEGYWITDFVADKNHVVEIYCISTISTLLKSNDIKKFNLSIQHFKENGVVPMLNAKGFGTFQGRNICITYYTSSVKVQRSGTMILKLRDHAELGLVLAGSYSECINEDIVSADTGNIELSKIQMSFFNKIKFSLGLKYSKDYNDIILKIDKKDLNHL